MGAGTPSAYLKLFWGLSEVVTRGGLGTQHPYLLRWLRPLPTELRMTYEDQVSLCFNNMAAILLYLSHHPVNRYTLKTARDFQRICCLDSSISWNPDLPKVRAEEKQKAS